MAAEVPESRFDADATLVPETPEGYDDPAEN